MKIITGGQTGADRAALDWARERGISTGGWVPLGGLAEDGPVLEAYPELLETTTADPAERTERNVREADMVIVLRGAESPGTELAIRLARSLGKPLLVFQIGQTVESAAERGTINVVGPRQSEDPRAYQATWQLLDSLFSSQ